MIKILLAFACLIADHASHFTLDSLGRLAANAGWEIAELSDSWIAKELSLLAGVGRASAQTGVARAGSLARIRAQISWLARFVECAQQAADHAPSFGLFGSSIAASWLTAAMGERVRFFVEEDAARVGRTHLGRPILSPAQVSRESVVYLALIPRIAARIFERLGSSIDLRQPPPLSEGTHG